MQLNTIINKTSTYLLNADPVSTGNRNTVFENTNVSLFVSTTKLARNRGQWPSSCDVIISANIITVCRIEINMLREIFNRIHRRGLDVRLCHTSVVYLSSHKRLFNFQPHFLQGEQKWNLFLAKSLLGSRVVRQTSECSAGSCGTKACRASFIAFYKTVGDKPKGR
jgi:hypothetical protein